MKCLLFIITLCSIARFIDVHRENDADSSGSGDDEASVQTDEDNSPEESEQITYSDSEAESSEQERREKETNNEQKPGGSNSYSKDEELRHKLREETMARYLSEMQAGDNSDLIGQNQHIEQSHYYNDLGRRSVAIALENIAAENLDYLTPEKAPPELVLLVAKESALLRAGIDDDLGSDFDRKKILRSGDYWNGVWKEEVKPKGAMRSSSQKKKLGSIKAKINPGTELYKVVSRMKKISPQLLYIINKKQP